MSDSKRINEILIENGLITDKTLQRALTRAKGQVILFSASPQLTGTRRCGIHRIHYGAAESFLFQSVQPGNRGAAG